MLYIGADPIGGGLSRSVGGFACVIDRSRPEWGVDRLDRLRFLLVFWVGEDPSGGILRWSVEVFAHVIDRSRP